LAKTGLLSKIFGIRKKSVKIDVKGLLNRVEKNPKDIKAILKLGDYFSSKRKKKEAIKYYTQAADLCIEDGFINKGIAIVKKISTLDAQDPQFLIKLADLYMRQNLFGEAIIQIQKALELDPKNENARETLEKLTGTANNQKNFIEALKADKEVQITSRTTTPDEIIREAKEQIRKQITEEDVTEHYDLGVAYMEMELYESAIEEFSIVLNSPDYFEDSTRLIYECFFAMDRMRDAIAFFENLLEQANLSPFRKELIRFYIGMAYEDSLDMEKALEIFEDLLNRGYPKQDILIQKIEKLKTAGKVEHIS